MSIGWLLEEHRLTVARVADQYSPGITYEPDDGEKRGVASKVQIR